MKENIISLINNPEITAERIAETFRISKVDYNKMAEEICEYFSDVYSDNISHKEKFEALVNAYYDTIIRVINKTIDRIDILQSESKNKFSEIYNAKKRIDKLFDNYFEVYIADYSYHDTAFLADEKEKAIESKKEIFILTVNKKLCEFCDDADLSAIIHMRTLAKEIITNRKKELRENIVGDEYYKVLSNDKIIHFSEDEISCYNDAIDAFLYIKSFDESYENNINEEKEKEYRKIYIKRRIHQFSFKKEEMYQYFIKPFLTFEENTSLAREVFQDIGCYIPTNGGNMKKLFYAYYDLCMYEVNKLLFLLCCCNPEHSNSAKYLKSAILHSKEILKELRDVYYYYTNNYQSDERASNLVYGDIDNIIDKIKKHYDHKVKCLYPETVALYDKISNLYEEIEHSPSEYFLFNKKPNPHNEAIYAEINNIRKEIDNFVNSNTQ